MDFKEIIEPLRLLFKAEVRQLGRELGLPEYLVMRQPFPGPGLGIRLIGEIKKDKMDTLRRADFLFMADSDNANRCGTMSHTFSVPPKMHALAACGDVRLMQ